LSGQLDALEVSVLRLSPFLSLSGKSVLASPADDATASAGEEG